MYMVSPWMDNGHINGFLAANPTADRPNLVSLWVNRFRLYQVFTDSAAQILGIAEGLAYLHNQKPAVIHGDLRGVGSVALGQFGYSCLLVRC